MWLMCTLEKNLENTRSRKTGEFVFLALRQSTWRCRRLVAICAWRYLWESYSRSTVLRNPQTRVRHASALRVAPPPVLEPSWAAFAAEVFSSVTIMAGSSDGTDDNSVTRTVDAVVVCASVAVTRVLGVVAVCACAAVGQGLRHKKSVWLWASLCMVDGS